MKRVHSISCWEVESDMNSSSKSLHSVINTLQEPSFTQKTRGRQIIPFIGHSFSRVNKDPLENAWLVAGLYILFLSISKNTVGYT